MGDDIAAGYVVSKLASQIWPGTDKNLIPERDFHLCKEASLPPKNANYQAKQKAFINGGWGKVFIGYRKNDTFSICNISENK